MSVIRCHLWKKKAFRRRLRSHRLKILMSIAVIFAIVVLSIFIFVL